MKRRKRFVHARIQRGEIELVLVVVREKVLQRRDYFSFRSAFADRPPHEHGRAIADVRVDTLMREWIAAHVSEGRVDGVSQIELRIDQRSVKVENYQIICTHSELEAKSELPLPWCIRLPEIRPKLALLTLPSARQKRRG